MFGPGGSWSIATQSCRSSSTPGGAGKRFASRSLAAFNRPLATMLGLDPDALDGPAGAAIFAGNALPEGGAADRAGVRRAPVRPLHHARRRPRHPARRADHARRRSLDIQLKGAGQTRFSRRGDGRAALGPMLREYIISEAMAALGIPTTRSLAVVTTGEPVYRETALDGAVLTRVAASHIRVGTMQWAAAHDDQHATAGAGRLRERATTRSSPTRRQSTWRSSTRSSTARRADRPLAAGRVHPRRDEHRQHGDLRAKRSTTVRARSWTPTIPRRCSARSTTAAATPTAISRRSRSGTWRGLPKRCCRCSIRTAIARLSVPRRRSTAFPTLFEQYWLDGMRAKLGLFTQEDDDKALADDLLAWMQRRSADFTNTFRISDQRAAARGRCDRRS